VIAKQYTMTLPADYDMGIVRRRVSDRGEAFDDFPGLGLKAFLITERAAGATSNRYSAFYLWLDVAGINEFLYGGPFANVSGAFGRPLIEHWIGMHVLLGQTDHPPSSATREDLAVADGDPGALRERELGWIERCRNDDRGLYAAAVALDPFRWQLVRFALWAQAPVQEDSGRGLGYEVLHISRPDLDGLR
jgi:hypothetical protein